LRTTKLITISVFPDFLKKVDEVAKEESRTRSELFREVMRRYIAAKELQRLQKYGEKQAEKLGIREDEVQNLVDEYRAKPSRAESRS
jgi:CopG family transcriptional regulator/antitoxin EndoAI